MIISNIWENKKMFQTTNQHGVYHIFPWNPVSDSVPPDISGTAHAAAKSQEGQDLRGVADVSKENAPKLEVSENLNGQIKGFSTFP